jgi:replication factor C subunit 1
MADFWLDKYKPTKLNDVIGNTDTVSDINRWVRKFHKNKNKVVIDKNSPANNIYNNMIISGNHGVGKEVIIKLILELNNYYYDWLQYHDEKSSNLLDNIENNISRNANRNFYINDKKKYALVVDDIEKITLKREKTRLLDLIKNNNVNGYFPIIFISNFQHNKLITEIKKYSSVCTLVKPTNNEIMELMYTIIKNESIKIESKDIINVLLHFAQNDVRKLILTLYDIKLSFDENVVTLDNLEKFIFSSQKKEKDTSLFDATRQLIDSYSGINYSLKHYNVDKVLVPLTIYENYYKSLAYENRRDDIKIINTLKNVTKSISIGDVIETNIYTDQNWYLHDIHGFYTCAKSSYYINKYKKRKKEFNINFSCDVGRASSNHVNINQTNTLQRIMSVPVVKPYDMNFSSDLNQTSLKNINKKNIINLQKLFINKSFSDILTINKIVYNFIQNNKIEELFNLLVHYNVTVKMIENFIKIDKSLELVKLPPKSKKRVNALIKTRKLKLATK